MTTSAAVDEKNKKLFPLVLGAIGVVFGDIGTSPLYAVKESFHVFHLPTDQGHIFGLLSIIFWLSMLIVTVKYIGFIMRADNRGEGGNLALLALARRITMKKPKLNMALALIGMIGGALFFSDAVITPAISILSAMEGLELVKPELAPFIVPLSLSILFMLFGLQANGTGRMGALFGPVTLVWFVTLGALGIHSLLQTPEIIMALNPIYAFEFFVLHPALSFWTLGSAMLAITGVEALYADMGHFGPKPIRIGWFALVWPCLLLNYFGQGALLLRVPQAIENPFYLLAPSWFLMPLLFLATAATVVASQAVITGTFSVARQAILLGFMPRLKIEHTNEEHRGQIYMPTINWLLFGTIFILVIAYQNSTDLAAAYGLAVSGTMLLTSILFLIVARIKWRWPLIGLIPLGGFILIIETALVIANFAKIMHGAWLPLAMSAVLILIFTTWSKGQKLLNEQMRRQAVSPDGFISVLKRADFAQVPGTAVYLSRQRAMVPPSFLMQLSHIKALHERVIFLTIQIESVPYVGDTERCEIKDLGKGFTRVILHYGFKDEPDVIEGLSHCKEMKFDVRETSFFLGNESILPTPGFGMPMWRDWIFMMMKRNSGDVVNYLKLPYDRVVELKTQHIV